MNVSCSLLELIGIGAVVPFILLLTKPEMIESNRYIKFIYDIVQPDSFRDFMVIMAGGLIIFFILKNLYTMAVFTAQQMFLKHKYEAMTNNLLISYLLKPYKFFFNHSGSELLRNVQSVQPIILIMFTSIFNILAEFITIGVLGLFLLFINPLQTIGLGGGLLIFVALGLRLMKHKTQALGIERLSADETFISNITQGLASIKETRILGNEKTISNRNSHTVKRLGWLNVITNVLSVAPRFYIETLAIAAVLIIMIIMLQTGWQEERIILELSLFGMIAVRLMPSVTRISVSITNIRASIPAFNNVYNDIQEARHKIVSDRKMTKYEFKDSIELRNVNFAYDAERQILDNV
jgi:ABC-type bacteriocin/lantibiotic exporter with double-glycine peptidase domain